MFLLSSPDCDQVAIKLAPITSWLSIKQLPSRSGSATLADALESLPVAGSSENAETKESSEGLKVRPQAPAFGSTPAGRAWERTNEVSKMEELWRPSPKVSGGIRGEGQANNLCERGILAVQGNLQPVGRVVFILENNHRVSWWYCSRNKCGVPLLCNLVCHAFKGNNEIFVPNQAPYVCCPLYEEFEKYDCVPAPGRTYELFSPIRSPEGRREAGRQRFVRDVSSNRPESIQDAHRTRGPPIALRRCECLLFISLFCPCHAK